MNMTQFRPLTLLLIAALLCSSCERLLMTDDIPATATHTFGYLWQQVDKQYSLFDVKQVDWQAVYDSLSPQVYDGMTADSLFRICAAMLGTLHDGHVNLYAGFDVGRCDSLYYDFYAHSGIDFNTVMLYYLGPHYRSAGGVAHQGLYGGRVIYFYYGSFSTTLSIPLLRQALRSYPDAQGLVLDIRGNGGGSLKNVFQLLSILPSDGQPLYTSQIKSGPQHNDFTPPATTYAPQVDAADAFDKPVVVLTDRACFSAASLFALCTKAYDNVLLMGDTTGGGLALPSMGFLPNAWRYRLSVTRTLSLDGQNYENGVPPDIHLSFDRSAAQQRGHDNIIDSACAYIVKVGE
ncbi:MAG: S41 family peptidase [Bacteroidales bacterium]|nr:S41 family peptidase [Bacteroidales bacterium]